jgi:hypothetical protein
MMMRESVANLKKRIPPRPLASLVQLEKGHGNAGASHARSTHNPALSVQFPPLARPKYP